MIFDLSCKHFNSYALLVVLVISMKFEPALIYTRGVN